MAEESFEFRVKRLFGSKLFETVPSNSFPTSSWSVAGGEVERREWNRERGGAADDREDAPTSAAFYEDDGCLARRSRRKKSAADRKREFEGAEEEDDDAEEEEEEERGVDEEKEIRDSVGLDPTLDNEDEEDEYDKAALCREDAGERMYMRDVKDHGPYLNLHAIIPDCLEEPSVEAHPLCKDPRADHFAASVRLKEDKSVAENCPVPAHDRDRPSSGSSMKITENGVTLKPILKRKEGGDDPKPKKRVRFDQECKDHDEEELQDFPMVPQCVETSEVPKIQTTPREESAGVPDYIRNPTKYTHYTFDSESVNDDETNKQAFADFLNLVKRAKPGQSQPEFPVELPKSLTFTPRKKSVDVVPMDESPGNEKGKGQLSSCSVVIAAGVDRDDYVCEMDEDDAETPVVEMNVSSRRARQYRSKTTTGDSG
ncbi:RNA-binding protein 25-like [Iris pallida]|uniref:U5 small nuclear ribonucleoprotein TSSC4 n=1 Tax=Iris pallida TaxID=29817 RepID=A0AAX6HZB0_IRIPA|nr:RNA-binding protein 25-like [Iris pallida]